MIPSVTDLAKKCRTNAHAFQSGMHFQSPIKTIGRSHIAGVWYTADTRLHRHIQGARAGGDEGNPVDGAWRLVQVIRGGPKFVLSVYELPEVVLTADYVCSDCIGCAD